MHSATHVGTPSIRTVRLGPAVKAEVAKMNEGGAHPHEPRRLVTRWLKGPRAVKPRSANKPQSSREADVKCDALNSLHHTSPSRCIAAL